MKSIRITLLMAILYTLTGCQSISVPYQVETEITERKGSVPQYLISTRLYESAPDGTKIICNPQVIVRQGVEEDISVVNEKTGKKMQCIYLVEKNKISSSVAISKNGKVIWSSKQTTIFKD